MVINHLLCGMILQVKGNYGDLEGIPLLNHHAQVTNRRERSLQFAQSNVLNVFNAGVCLPTLGPPVVTVIITTIP